MANRLWVVLALCGLLSCVTPPATGGGEVEPGNDAGSGGGAGADAGAGGGGGFDAGEDAGAEDSGTDAGDDAGAPDSGTDAGVDAGAPSTDAGSFDGGAPRIVLPARGGGAMWGGARYGAVLYSDGTVWNWGFDWFGHLGDGDPLADKYLPVHVVDADGGGQLGSIVSVASGEPFTIALKSDGTVWAWGNNSLFGNLGTGSDAGYSSVPVQVHGPGNVGFLSSIVGIGSRGYHALALASDSTVWAWGNNAAGQLGDGTTTNAGVPVHARGPGGVGFLSGAWAVTGGYVHSLAVSDGGTLWAWGGNANGQLGDGTTTPRPFPFQVDPTNLTNVVQVSAGWKHTLALRSDGTVWAWGQNDLGEVGNGCTLGVNCADVLAPVQVPITNVVSVAAGDCHSAALKSDGTVWTWGCNHHNGKNPAVDPVGQLGNGDLTFTDVSSPVQVHGPNSAGFLTDVVEIAARDYHNYAVLSDGGMWSWGSNLNGQLGTGSCCAPSTFPVQVRLP